eukprot:m.483826 g.483826  ORF g.483826 m.483826 type:complete len:369 (+) comp23085_c0_seq1:545-1651(+)
MGRPDRAERTPTRRAIGQAVHRPLKPVKNPKRRRRRPSTQPCVVQVGEVRLDDEDPHAPENDTKQSGNVKNRKRNSLVIKYFETQCGAETLQAVVKLLGVAMGDEQHYEKMANWVNGLLDKAQRPIAVRKCETDRLKVFTQVKAELVQRHAASASNRNACRPLNTSRASMEVTTVFDEGCQRLTIPSDCMGNTPFGSASTGTPLVPLVPQPQPHQPQPWSQSQPRPTTATTVVETQHQHQESLLHQIHAPWPQQQHRQQHLQQAQQQHVAFPEPLVGGFEPFVSHLTTYTSTMSQSLLHEQQSPIAQHQGHLPGNQLELGPLEMSNDALLWAELELLAPESLAGIMAGTLPELVPLQVNPGELSPVRR